MEPIITVNEYPIGWEWLDRVPLEDFTWLIEIFSTITDNTDTYDFATFDKEATNGEPPYPVIEIDRKGLAYFMNDDQGYDYSPSQVEAILFGILQLTPEHQDIIVIDLKKHLKILYSRQRPSGRDDNPIYLLLQCHQEMGIQSQGNRNPSST